MIPSLPRATQPKTSGKSAKKRASKGKGKGKGKGARGSPKAKWQKPMPVDTDLEEMIASQRHHDAEMEEEGRKHMGLDAEAEKARLAEEERDEQQKVQGLNFDDRRKKRGRRNDDDDEEDAEAAHAAAQEAKDMGLVGADGAGRYFQDLPEERMGDLSLTNPNEMKRLLGPSVRFAQHAMLLAGERMKEGATRESAIAFLAELYQGVGDRAYALKALRDFGPATGILDIYPLELVDHLLTHVPSFCTKIQRGQFLTSSEGSTYRAKAGHAITLSYPEELRVRGFAIDGGARPGYVLEPTDPPGTYELAFQTPGNFKVLISAISKSGDLLIETIACEIEAGDDVDFEDNVALQRERAHESAIEETENPREKKKDDLTIHFKRRI